MIDRYNVEKYSDSLTAQENGLWVRYADHMNEILLP